MHKEKKKLRKSSKDKEKQRKYEELFGDVDSIPMEVHSLSTAVTVMMEESDDDVEEARVVNLGIASHIGTRKSQQDSSVIGVGETVSPEFAGKLIAAVCDGMGGLEGGELASSICVKTLYEDFFNSSKINSYPQFLRDEIDKVDELVSNLKDDSGKPIKAGSTFVAIVVDKGQLFWATVGDSHLYIIRGEEILQVNRDHNYYMLLKERVKAGDMTEAEAQENRQKEALISYIGMNGVKYVDINEKPFTMLPGDCVVLCSDGLYKILGDDEIHAMVNMFPTNMHLAAKEMIDETLRRNKPHQDNTTVILFKNI